LRFETKKELHEENYKIVLIGIDAGEWDVINNLIEEKNLPNFERFKKEGSYGYLISPYSYSPISWTEIATGKTKEKHGIEDFFNKDRTRLTYSLEVRSKRIWNILNENGKTTGVYHWLISWPPEKVNGFMVSDWLTQNTTYTFPPELGKELKEKGLNLHDRTDEVVEEMLYLLEKYKVDFFTGVDYHIHWLEHLTWKYWKPEEFNVTNREEIIRHKRILTNFYQKMDSFLEKLERLVGKEAVIFVVSDHGMKTQSPVEYHISFKELLKELNLLKYSNQTFEILSGSMLSQVSSNIPYPYAVEFLFLEPEINKTEIAHKLLEIRYEDNKSFFSSFSFEEENKVKFTINEELLKSHIKEDVKESEEGGFPATYVSLLLPTGKNFKLYVYEKSGEHPPGTNGIILVKGPMIKKNYSIKNATVYDIAPTILYLYGIPIPKDMDGRVLTEIIEDHYLATHPVKYTSESSQKEVGGAIEINETMREKVEEKLRELGYIQ
jgi:predicted AlkP superfamily phosphohydrolase/phosphomutase